jgi:hypothetical protein
MDTTLAVSHLIAGHRAGGCTQEFDRAAQIDINDANEEVWVMQTGAGRDAGCWGETGTCNADSDARGAR